MLLTLLWACSNFTAEKNSPAVFYHLFGLIWQHYFEDYIKIPLKHNKIVQARAKRGLT